MVNFKSDEIYSEGEGNEIIYAGDGSIISFEWEGTVMHCISDNLTHLIIDDCFEVFECKVLFKSEECMQFEPLSEEELKDWIEQEAWDHFKKHSVIWL